MSHRKINLSSPENRGRIKKFDQYNHHATRSDRVSLEIPDASTVHATRLATTPTVTKNTTKLSMNSSAAKAKLAFTQRPGTHKPAVKRQSSRLLASRARPSNNTSNSQKQGRKLALFAVATAQESPDAEYTPSSGALYFSQPRKRTKLQMAMYSVAIIVFLFSSVVSVQTLLTNKQAQDQLGAIGEQTVDDQGVLEGTGNDPSEQKISDAAIGAYTVQNPEEPRFLRIPELGVYGRIKSLGIDSKGAVDAPYNIHDAGWYNGGARPGNPVGSSLILGHVSGWSGPGIFKDIDRLVAGSQFEIEKGSGEVVRYEVTGNKRIPLAEVDMGQILGTEVAGEHDLKLMTCAGSYSRATNTFEDRFVVYARQII